MPNLLHRELTGQIIGAYYDVYNSLNHFYPEYIYENALARELTRRGIHCIQQPEYEVFYKDWLVGVQKLDVLVAEDVVVETKVKPQLKRLDFAQTISYAKTIQKEVGLLFNFGGGSPEFRRLFYRPHSFSRTMPQSHTEFSDLLFPELSREVIGSVFEVYHELGPGFIHRIYARACYREMTSRGLAVKPLNEILVRYRGEVVGEVKLGHMIVEGRLMLFPLAVRDTDQIVPANLREWMTSQEITLGIIANFYAERPDPIFLKETRTA